MTRVKYSGMRSQVDALFRKKFGDGYPSLKVCDKTFYSSKDFFKEISSNVSYVFTNTEPLIDFATPTLSRVIDIGGLGAKEPKELDEVMNQMQTMSTNDVLSTGLRS